MGSTSYLTNKHGIVSQHVEYIPFGETLIESHLNNQNNPYLYNGKELDAETGFYYYGARYYEPKMSLWLSVDPLADKFLDWSPYNYAVDNPIRFIDPDGKSPDDIIYINSKGEVVKRIITSEINKVYMIKNTNEWAAKFRPMFNTQYLEKPTSMSISFSGSASKTGEKDSEKRDRYVATGNMTISVGFENGVEFNALTVSAVSGPYGFGPIPNGDYEGTNIVNTSESGMVRDGVGFKVFLSDNDDLNRNGLRIHPDQVPSTGTAGCIGITESAAQLERFKGFIVNHIDNNPNSNIDVNVNITNNPNYNRPNGGTQNSGE